MYIVEKMIDCPSVSGEITLWAVELVGLNATCKHLVAIWKFRCISPSLILVIIMNSLG